MAACALIVLNKGALSTEDTAIRDRLVALGHTVTLFSDEDAEADSSLYAFGVIGRVTNTTLAAKYQTWAKPIVVADAPSWVAAHMDLTANQFNESPQSTVYVEDATHTLAGGLAVGTHTISTAGDIRYYTRIADLPTGAVYPVRRGSASDPVIFGCEAGDARASGGANTFPARRVGFGLGRMSDVSNANWNALFDAAVSWVTASSVTITIDQGESANVDGTLQLTATVSDGSTPTWASDNTAVATVDSTGLVTRVAPGGTCNITATSGAASDSIAVTTRVQKQVTILHATAGQSNVVAFWKPDA